MIWKCQRSWMSCMGRSIWLTWFRTKYTKCVSVCFNFSVEHDQVNSLIVYLCTFNINKNYKYVRKSCEARYEVQQVSHAWSHLRLVFLSKWETGTPRVNLICTWERCELLGIFLKQLLSQDITSAAHSDNWLPGVAFNKTWFSCLAPAGPHLETFLLSPQSDWQAAASGECLTIHCLCFPHSS